MQITLLKQTPAPATRQSCKRTEENGETPAKTRRYHSIRRHPKGWPPERRHRQAQNIRKTRPWLHSTGPKTAKGKSISRYNARKHGFRDAGWRNLRRALTLQRRFLHCVNAALKIVRDVEKTRRHQAQIRRRPKSGAPLNKIIMAHQNTKNVHYLFHPVLQSGMKTESRNPPVRRSLGEGGTPEPLAKGRAATINPVGRFEKLDLESDLSDIVEDPDFPDRALKTQFFRDSSKSVLSYSDSPDNGYFVNLNPYRGCEHGCIYCFARPTHEYLGLSAGLDFESKIFVKHDAPALLRKELAARSYKPATIAMSGATDPYQPIERKMALTRACLEVLAEARNPVAIITKNHLVTRDTDILADMARWNGACVNISLTTLDPDLAKKMEPRTSRPAARLKAIETLSRAGIPVNVMTAPIVPGLTDHEIPDLLKAAADAGARSANYIIVRLSHGLRDLFSDWLEENYALKKPRVLSRIRDLRGGKLNDTRWHVRKKGEGPYADLIAQTFMLNKKKYGLGKAYAPLSTDHFRRPDEGGQMELF